MSPVFLPTSRLPVITDRQWQTIAPLLPRRKSGRQRGDDRLMVSAILFCLGDGCSWQELPKLYGNPHTVHSRYARWSQDGTLARVMAALNFEPLNHLERARAQGSRGLNRHKQHVLKLRREEFARLTR